jgi:hypothetical protein
MAFPFLSFLWLQLGAWLNLPRTPVRDPGTGLLCYYAVQKLLWILLSFGPAVVNMLHGDLHTSSAFLLAIAGSVVFDCTMVYVLQLSLRCGNPRWYHVKP